MPITPEEILELDAYCKERHIELAPSISTFGHLYKMLGCKQPNHLCELDGWQGSSFRSCMAALPEQLPRKRVYQTLCGWQRNPDF